MLFPCITYVPTLARFCNSSNTPVPRFISSPSLLLRSSNNFLPTLAVITTGNSGRVSSFDHAYICHSSSSVSQSESAQDKTSPCAINASINSSVVKIFSISRKPILDKPWLKSKKEEVSNGSGFVISGRRILTSACIVENHTYLRVKKNGSRFRYKAKVEAVGHYCGLATLVVDNEKFWEGMNPLELRSDIPFIGETISLFGYPHDDNISVTKSIVWTVEHRKEYDHDLLTTVRMEAALDHGIEGGPVVTGNKVAGLAFRYNGHWAVVSYIIPTPVIKHFLSGVEERGQYMGFGSLEISCQPMENAQMRKHYQMSHDMTGILIIGINPLSNAHKILKKHDVILAIDGVPIGNDETVPFRGKERINFNHLVSMKKPGETCLFKVLRDGREYEFNIKLNSVPSLVPLHQLDLSYYIFAGFVFVPLTKPYIHDAYTCICACALKRKAKKAGEQIVIISQVLSDGINTGYRSFKDLQVKKVNGVEVINLKHLSELIEKCCTEELRLDLEEEKIIVLNNKSAKEATSSILDRHRIPSAMSKNLQ